MAIEAHRRRLTRWITCLLVCAACASHASVKAKRNGPDLTTLHFDSHSHANPLELSAEYIRLLEQAHSMKEQRRNVTTSSHVHVLLTKLSKDDSSLPEVQAYIYDTNQTDVLKVHPRWGLIKAKMTDVAISTARFDGRHIYDVEITNKISKVSKRLQDKLMYQVVGARASEDGLYAMIDSKGRSRVLRYKDDKVFPANVVENIDGQWVVAPDRLALAKILKASERELRIARAIASGPQASRSLSEFEMYFRNHDD